MTSWQTFAEEGNRKVWGSAFRWANKGTRNREPPSVIRQENGSMTEDIESTAKELLRVFVPDDIYNIDSANFDDADTCNTYEHVTPTVVRAAVWRIGPNRAPGPD